MLRIVLSFLLLIVSSLGGAQAQTIKKDFARCVQGQLNALGQKAGRVDGLLGRATARAYNRLRAEEGFESIPEKFDTHSMIFSCRYIGEKDAELKKFWPAWKRSYTIKTGAIVPGGIIKYIEQSIPVIHRRFAAFNMQYASSVNLHIFHDRQTGQGFYASNSVVKEEETASNFEALYTFNCSNDSIGGWSENNDIYICLNYEEDSGNIHSDLAAFLQSSFDDHQFRFQEVMTGEMFNVSQRELLGAFVLEAKDIKKLQERKALEPAWINEGVAQYFELRFGGAGKEESVYYSDLATKLNIDRRRLHEYEAISLDLSVLSKGADLGDLAAFKLQDRRGLKQFHIYFKNVGLGVPWKQAFEQAFGVSIEKFYADYAN